MDTRYPPIEDYAFISDCHCAALISRNGSIDWCCMPRLDDDSCFGRLLDWDKGGYCAICPAGAEFTTTRRYLPQTMILETRFQAQGGEIRLLDFFAMDEVEMEHARYDHVRILEGVAGEVDVNVTVSPRFDYGEIVPYMKCSQPGTYTATGSNKGLIIRSGFPLEVHQHRDLSGRVTVRAGQRIRMVVQFQYPELIDKTLAAGGPDDEEVDRSFERTRDWWRDWANRMRPPSGETADAQTVRSTIVLKALTFQRTGAIAAAATTSLPEWPGGTRNWDYRFSWIRDSVFTVRALHELGFTVEADRFHQFIQRSAAGDADQMQIMYGVDGKRRLTEIELRDLEGYRHSRPVRIGNHAASQMQLDVYGELLEMAWEWHVSGHRTEPDYWTFLVDVVEMVCGRWQQPDHGIWEVRGEPEHFVHSKAMCWAALNRGILLAEQNGLEAPVVHWREVRDQVRRAIETEGYDARRGIFVQSFGSSYLDAALLLLPRVGFVAYDDPRMLRTAEAICAELDHRGLLRRYNAPDGLPGPEGAFLPCTFWLAACLACQGRLEQAWHYYRSASECANDLGLFSEEFDTGSGRMLGNFPQGLSHVSQVTARLSLAQAERGGKAARPQCQ
ncbi:glycoside hydrolase family 15 protein [Noviherbaspirillum sp. ST9]|uniref:glycoside hydrolase family 15 protein n=1 Tax=Noviherbaspirillum sp. ST9 TaxID=3401606 RepID=UPI003B5869EC